MNSMVKEFRDLKTDSLNSIGPPMVEVLQELLQVMLLLQMEEEINVAIVSKWEVIKINKLIMVEYHLRLEPVKAFKFMSVI
jgi:hypothetical protein